MRGWLAYHRGMLCAVPEHTQLVPSPCTILGGLPGFLSYKLSLGICQMLECVESMEMEHRETLPMHGAVRSPCFQH